MARRGTCHLHRFVAAFVVGLLAALAVAAPAPALAAPRRGQAQSPPPKAFVVVDAGTGDVLLADKAHDVLPPASIVKVMTALTAAERLPSDAMIDISPRAAGQPASRIDMRTGQRWPFEQAMASLMMVSANDAAYALAEAAGGSLERFAAAMNETAQRLGMNDSSLADPAGLDDEASFGGGSRMSAYDIAIATRNAMAVPDIARWAGLRKYDFVDPTGLARSLTNHNRLLPGGSRAYPGATGLKSGFTDRAGHTLTATATRDGRSLIVVVLDTYDTYGWAAQLFDQGFATPAAAGTGARLPAVAVRPFAQRAADRDARASLVGEPGSTTAPAAGTDETTAARSPRSASVGGDAIAAQRPTGDRGGSSGVLNVRNVIIVVALLLMVVVVGRRRVVRRRRARRLAEQRVRAAKMRSGALTVVDGRYRMGRRTGPPVESEMRIRHHDEG
jgi:D-alanyl-D-alanine carboxypeptidase (penicillin-binding protein 5/6)